MTILANMTTAQKAEFAAAIIAAGGVGVDTLNAKIPFSSPAAQRANLADLRGVAARDRSAAQAAATYADSASSATLESWTNLTAWTGATSTAQVSGGALYNNGGTASTAGITRPWALGTTGKGRAVFVVNMVTGGTGRILIGVSSDAAGGAPAASNANVKGVSFGPGTAASSNLGTDTSVLGIGGSNQVAPIAGQYLVTVTVDEQSISVVATRTGALVLNSTGFGVDEYRALFPRAGFNIQTLYIQNTSSLNLTGISAGPVGSRNAIASLPASFGIEAIGRTVTETQRTVRLWNSNSTGTATIKVSTPPGYDSRIQWPTVVFFHGNGSTENQLTDSLAILSVELLNDGFVVITAAGPNLFSWGHQPSLDAYVAAVNFARDNFNVGSIGFLANSMGGIESLLALSDGRISGVTAWAGTSPTYSLADNFANSLFTNVILTAYDIGSTGNKRPYATATAGYDPSLMVSDAFRGLPMLIMTAGDDVAVTPANNGYALGGLVAPYSPELIMPLGLTGGHSFPLGTAQAPLSGALGLQASVTPAQVVGAFMQKYLR